MHAENCWFIFTNAQNQTREAASGNASSTTLPSLSIREAAFAKNIDDTQKCPLADLYLTKMASDYLAFTSSNLLSEAFSSNLLSEALSAAGLESSGFASSN